MRESPKKSGVDSIDLVTSMAARLNMLEGLVREARGEVQKKVCGVYHVFKDGGHRSFRSMFSLRGCGISGDDHNPSSI